MKENLQIFTVPLGLFCSFLCSYLIAMSIASPLSLVDPPQRLVLPQSLTNKNISNSPGLGKGWPGGPFSVPIETVKPDEYCCLSFTKTSDLNGTSAETHFFLLQVLQEMINVKAQPKESIPKAFDISECDVRFKMEPVPQHPMTLGMAQAALEIIYGIVIEAEVREFQALVICQGLALGRFRTWLNGE